MSNWTLPCPPFSLSTLKGPSLELSPFLSTNCLSSSLQFSLLLSSLLLFSLSFLFILFWLWQAVREKRGKMVRRLILLALGVCFTLILRILTDLCSLKGVGRMVGVSLPLSGLVVAVTYVIVSWFETMVLSTVNKKTYLSRNLWISFFGFQLVFQVVFWALMLSAGRYDIIDPKRNNLFAALGFLWLGIAAITISFAILWLGKQVTHQISQANFSAEEGGRYRLVSQKIRRYTLLQALMWLSGGISGISISLWAFLSLGNPHGMANFFFVQTLWLNPAKLVAALLFVYSCKQSNDQKVENSTPIQLQFENGKSDDALREVILEDPEIGQ